MPFKQKDSTSQEGEKSTSQERRKSTSQERRKSTSQERKTPSSSSLPRNNSPIGPDSNTANVVFPLGGFFSFTFEKRAVNSAADYKAISEDVSENQANETIDDDTESYAPSENEEDKDGIAYALASFFNTTLENLRAVKEEEYVKVCIPVTIRHMRHERFQIPGDDLQTPVGSRKRMRRDFSETAIADVPIGDKNWKVTSGCLETVRRVLREESITGEAVLAAYFKLRVLFKKNKYYRRNGIAYEKNELMAAWDFTVEEKETQKRLTTYRKKFQERLARKE